MRYQMFGCSLLLAAAAVGCGGDDGGKVKVPDAKVFQDAPASMVDAPPPCLTPATIPAATVGSTAMPANGDFIRKTMSGQVFFGLGVYLDQSMKTAVDIIVLRPTAGFQTNTTYTFDPDPNAQTPVALAFIEDGLDATGMNSAHFLYASTGNTRFTAIGQTAGNPINGTVASSMFREIDQTSGADIAGGCTSTLTSLGFTLTQKTTVAFQPPSPAVWKLAEGKLGVELLPVSQ